MDVDNDFEDLLRAAGIRDQRPKREFSSVGENQEARESEPGEWSEPVSLDAPQLPRLPPDVLPGWLNEMTIAVASATETPSELAAMIGLATLAACCQGKIVVEVTRGYREPLCVWVCPGLDSANRKTAVVEVMTEPLKKWERDEARRLLPQLLRAQSEHATTEARIQGLRTKAAKDSEDFEKVRREIANLEANRRDLPKPPRLWTQDVTTEKLGILMTDNCERIAIIADEGGIFDVMAGRYNSGIPNIDLYLQAHAGSSVRVDRGSRPPVMMDHPALTMALSPQPEVLHGLADSRAFEGAAY